jgi:lambda family phage tail tape measure protein
MSSQIRKIIVQATSNGDKSIKDIANSLDKMNQSAKSSTDILSTFRNIAGTIFGAQILGVGVQQLTNMADSMNQLNSKLHIFVGEGDKATYAFQSLLKIADDTKAPLTSIATIFTRIATATERLKLSTDLQLSLTRILQQSFRVSGATAEEATASTIQFSQALSFGQLKGQELRSVLSQNSVLATIFSKSIEKSGKDIYKFAEAGGFTPKFVLKALITHMDDIEKKATKLAPTFEQTLNRAMNKFTESVNKLNNEFGISNGFANFVDFLLKNGDQVIAIVISLAATAIPKLVSSIQALNFAALLNPVGLFAAAIGGLTYLAIQSAGGVKQFVGEVRTLPAVLSLASLQLAELAFNIATLGTAMFIDNPVTKFLKGSQKDLSNYIKGVREAAKQIDSTNLKQPPSLKSLLDEVDKLKDVKKLTITEQIGLLNVRFNAGKIAASDYVVKLKGLETKEISEKFHKGTISIEKFNKEISDLKINDLARQLDIGLISIEQFNAGVNAFKIEELNRKFHSGKITLEDFNNQLVKLKIEGSDQNSIFTGILKGSHTFSESIGTMSDQIGKVTNNVFQGMEDKFLEFAKTGKANMKDFAQSILDELTRVAIRMAILKPLTKGIEGLFTSPSSSSGAISGSGSAISSPSVVAANGAIFNRGVDKFANGGIVGNPTYFGMSGGKMGLMGEAGPEAIVPLKRSSDGSLGVKASPTIVNVINNTQSQIDTKESTSSDGSKIIDVIVTQKVREGIANGHFDRAFQQSFGLNRRGI